MKEAGLAVRGRDKLLCTNTHSQPVLDIAVAISVTGRKCLDIDENVFADYCAVKVN
jgi:hypothetical protein